MNRRVLGFDIVKVGDPLPEHLQEKLMPVECKANSIGHCWHRGDTVTASIPPHWNETCCHCGETSTMRGSIHEEPGHGPHGSTRITTYRRIKARR